MGKQSSEGRVLDRRQPFGRDISSIRRSLRLPLDPGQANYPAILGGLISYQSIEKTIGTRVCLDSNRSFMRRKYSSSYIRRNLHKRKV